VLTNITVALLTSLAPTLFHVLPHVLVVLVAVLSSPPGGTFCWGFFTHFLAARFLAMSSRIYARRASALSVLTALLTGSDVLAAVLTESVLTGSNLLTDSDVLAVVLTESLLTGSSVILLTGPPANGHIQCHLSSRPARLQG